MCDLELVLAWISCPGADEVVAVASARTPGAKRPLAERFSARIARSRPSLRPQTHGGVSRPEPLGTRADRAFGHSSCGRLDMGRRGVPDAEASG